MGNSSKKLQSNEAPSASAEPASVDNDEQSHEFAEVTPSSFAEVISAGETSKEDPHKPLDASDPEVSARIDELKTEAKKRASDGANLFSFVSNDDIVEMANDIAKNGLLDPVVMLEDKILDGRHRWIACRLLDREPDLVEYDTGNGISPEAFLISRNLMRRSNTVSQRAMLVVRLLPSYAVEAGERKRAAQKNKSVEGEKGRAREFAARDANVSPRLVADAKFVDEKGLEEVTSAVLNGEIRVSKAKQIAKLDAGKQKIALHEALNSPRRRGARQKESTNGGEENGAAAKAERTQMPKIEEEGEGFVLKLEEASWQADLMALIRNSPLELKRKLKKGIWVTVS